MDLNKYIRDVHDFPKEGIVFKDISPLLSNPEAFAFAIDEMSKNIT
jgi:adenine phosphoribosyltransferase